MASANLSKTPSSAGNRKKFNFSFWIKGRDFVSDYIFFSASGSTESSILFDASSRLEYYEYNGSSKTTQVTTNRLFRDSAAWYHIVISVDTTQSTSSNRVKIYVNGTQETDLANATYGAQDFDSLFNNTTAQYIGSNASGGNFEGYMTHIHFNDGYTYDSSSFGETDTTSGIWKPKLSPSVTYGSNGYFLKFDNSGAMGTDSSGNSNTYAVGGTITQSPDTPSNNFATLNAANPGGGATSLSNGNLSYTRTDYSHNARSTLGFTKGKWYWEQKISDISVRIGLITSGFSNNLDTDSTDAYYGTYANGGVYLMNSASGTSWQTTNNDTSRSITTYTSAIGASAGDILMGAVDADAGKFWIGVNGTWMNSGDPAAGSNNQITFTNSTPDELQVYAGFGTSSSRTVNFNFGSGYFGTTAVTSANADANGFGAFEYAVPSGYYAICTKNIKEFG